MYHHRLRVLSTQNLMRRRSQTINTRYRCCLESAYFLPCVRRSNSDRSLAATCAKWSRYKPGTLAVGWTDGRVSFSDESSGTTASGSANSSKSNLIFPNEGSGSVVDLR